ncbi:uncharacterized protein N7483_013152 [Penicillium malachiteum]|uniref:uncharacterized protein n=1 Tax=Penicillium malachiteum TaxID=1324776 RepID=UPI002547199D|nr:uncharacterized protein N7483_013152 [Penicillium malachiteum]KAJ5715971.1 hypothetical protein N7483_013152 [Penicillium malachiteum]
MTNSFATSAYGLGDSAPLSFKLLAIRFLRTLLWVSLVFIPFSINNQRTPSAIAEDTLNKPWRPMPQKRITPSQATYFMLFFFGVVQTHGLICHGVGHRQSTLLLGLDIWYNNFGGADDNPVVRNGINALGYLCFISGALEVALGEKLAFPLHSSLGISNSEYYLPQWLFIIACIIISTVHLQDLYDQKGDAIRDRRTVPLVIGDTAARWSIAIPMAIWGIICPHFWYVRYEIFSLSLGLAYTVALRVLTLRSVENDRLTFLLWNCWIATVYVMPLFSETAAWVHTT